MKNRRLVSILTAVLSSFSTSLAVEGNVKTISTRGGKNITIKFRGNKSSTRPTNQTKKSRRRFNKLKHSVGNGVLPSSVKHNSGENAKSFGKNSNSDNASKNSSKNKPMAFAQNNPETVNQKSKNTIIPNVPNGVTFGVGGTALGVVAAVGTHLIADKKFNRSIIDKFRYGITVQGVIDYLKNNLKFVTKEVDGQSIPFLEVNLKDNRKCYIDVIKINVGNEYVFIHRPSYGKFEDISNESIKRYLTYNCRIDSCKIEDRLVDKYFDALVAHLEEGSLFGSKVEFSKKKNNIIAKEIRSLILNMLSKVGPEGSINVCSPLCSVRFRPYLVN